MLITLQQSQIKTIASFIVCSQRPPSIGNGSRLGPDLAVAGSNYTYACDRGYLPEGNNLTTECLDTGRYSMKNEDLAKCLYGN